MGASNIVLPLPLVRFNTLFPGQFGVQGTATKTGLRTTCEGAVFYVDPNAIGASDRRDGTDPECAFATVAAAIAACRPYRGDTILVMANNAWQYNNAAEGLTTPILETVTIDVPGVRLVGVCPSSSLGVPWHVPVAADTAITITATDVLVEGFVFTGALAMTAIDVIWNGAAGFGDGATIRHCFFDDNVTIGIRMEFSYNTDIHHNIFQGGNFGIWADPAVSSSQNCHIHDNQFMGLDTTAVFWQECDETEISDNVFYNAGAVAAAASPDVFIDTSAGTFNIVHHNTMSCVLPVAANGDYDNCNSSAATDAWIHNYCLNGPSVTRPT